MSYGGTAQSEIVFQSENHYVEPAEITNITEQWSECGNCGTRIDIDAINLIDYYKGECSLEDINSE